MSVQRLVFAPVVLGLVLGFQVDALPALTEMPASVAESPPVVSKQTVPKPIPGLNPDQVYHILVAEVAGRQGDMRLASTHYLKAAELTRAPELAELAVRAAIGAEDDAVADEAMVLWLTLAPTAPDAHQVAAFLRLKAGDREGALIHLQRLVELSGQGGEAAFAKAAAILARLPTPQERLAMMEALIERFPERADAHQALAMLAAGLSHPEVAERAARRAMALRPDWDEPRLLLVRLLLSDDKRAEARALLESFVEANPGARSLKMLYGQLLVDEREFSSARQVFESMLREYPKDPDILFAVGILSLQLEDLAGARLHFGRLYETGQRQDEAAFYLGQTAERAEDIATALDWYARVGGAHADDARVRLAFLRAKRGEVSQAREILQQMRDQSSDNALALFMVEAEILEEVGRSEEARAVYDEALAVFPENDSLLYARGLHAMKHGWIELGERDLRQIIASDPEHADALNALGYTLADQTDRFEEALALIERAHALKPDEPAILDSLGWVYYRLGDLERALEYLQQANALLQDGEIAAHLGEVLWALGRHAEAWAVWDKAVAADPDHVYLQAVVSRHRLSRGVPENRDATSN
ncbi:tetratricopeptide repeat protein [Thermochromatium tepidum]|uniref:Tetratricopeptide repeat protein n=1 Tax=Thermochromatium tepidum ATCC 43061 TaxID=316276 RepID=A0A6I6ECD2_THETI|nr:tetratricopeptide repeat protein [Thermochromatium tepidum]QGU32986.1 tetratricopeptide repeat protein [Thermochromatium tepidum ATCC 43061]